MFNPNRMDWSDPAVAAQVLMLGLPATFGGRARIGPEGVRNPRLGNEERARIRPRPTNRSWLPVPPPLDPWQTGGRWPDRDDILRHAKRAVRLYKIHLDLDMSPGEAAAWASNAQAESGGDHQRREILRRPRRDGSVGHGTFQVTHPDRRANFLRLVGVPVEQSTERQQLKFRDWELGNTYRRVAQRLRAAQSRRSPASPGDLAEIIARDYEAPGDIQETVVDRRNIANELLRLMDPRR